MTSTLCPDDPQEQDLTSEGRRVVDLICELYARPGCALGGMLHFMVYDENVDDDCFGAEFSVFADDYGHAYPADVTALCERIYGALKAMPEQERFAVVSCANRADRLRCDATAAART